jgi:hypothetical protein
MSDVRSRLGDVAQPSWLWGQRASCPLIATAWELGKTLGSPRRLESLGYKTRRAKGLQQLAPPTTLEIALTQ